MRRDESTLLDLARAMRLAIAFAGDLTPEELEGDALVSSAVQHQLLVMGEAVKRLSAAFTAAHPAIPWADMAGMRDRLVHRYDEVDARIVWRAVHEELPGLLSILRPLLPVET
jgi:uncharacterized protein with HEPN domain